MDIPNYTEEERDARKPIRHPLKAIRTHCLECVGGSSVEVELCTAPKCWLYPYRFGKNPFRAPPSEKQRENARQLSQKRRDNDGYVDLAAQTRLNWKNVSEVAGAGFGRVFWR